MAKSWGVLVAILALGCHTIRILVVAEGLAGPEVGDEHKVLSASMDMVAREQCSCSYTWCASLVAVLTLAALAWATHRESSVSSRSDEYKTGLLESQDQLHRAREEMEIADKVRNDLVTEVMWWQELHVDELHEKRHLRKELRQFQEEVEPGLLGELDRHETLVKLLDSRLDAVNHPCTTCFPPAGGGEAGSSDDGSDGRGSNLGGNDSGGGSDCSKEGGDGDGCGSRCREPRRDGVTKESGMWIGRSGRQAGQTYKDEFEQLVVSLSSLSAVHTATQNKGRNKSVEAGEGRGGAGVGVPAIEPIEKDREAMIRQLMRPLCPPLGDLGDADVAGNKTGDPNDVELSGPIALPSPLSIAAAVRTGAGMDGRGHAGGGPGVGVGPDSQRLLHSSGAFSSCSPLMAFGADGESADTDEATVRNHTAGQRLAKSTATSAGWRQPEVPEGVEEDLARAPPVSPKSTLALPTQNKLPTGVDRAGSHLTFAVGLTTEAAAVQTLAGSQRNTGGGPVGEPFFVSTLLTPGAPVGSSPPKVRGVSDPAVSSREASETSASAANVLAPPFSEEGAGRRAGEREPSAFGWTFSSRGSQSEEQSAPCKFMFERVGAPEFRSAALPVTEEVAAPKLATASPVGLASSSFLGFAGGGGGHDGGLVSHASEADNRADSPFIADGTGARMLASTTVAPVSTAGACAAKRLAAWAPAAGAARPSHRTSRSEGEATAFGVVGEKGVGTSPARGSLFNAAKYWARPNSRRRAKFVVGRHEVRGSTNLRAMKARLLAKQQEYRGLAAIERKVTEKERGAINTEGDKKQDMKEEEEKKREENDQHSLLDEGHQEKKKEGDINGGG